MNKFDFLTQLRAKLWSIPQSDAERSVDFYSEMIDDRMEEGLSEEEAVAAIGDLDEIVRQILAEAPQTPVVAAPIQKQRKLEPWMIVLLVLGAPLWIPLVAGVGSSVLGVYVSLWSVVIALYATAFALAVCAIGLLVAAFSLLWIRRFGKGAVMVGGALVCAGLAILIFLLSNLAAKGLVALTKLIWNGITGIFRRKERTV